MKQQRLSREAGVKWLIVATALIVATVHVAVGHAHGKDRSGGALATPKWPNSDVGQRDFETFELITDERRTPAKAWLISRPVNGIAHALEFFSGERVDRVNVSSDGLRFTFSDATGFQYSSILSSASRIVPNELNILAGWQKGDLGHDVEFGWRLIKQQYDPQNARTVIEAVPAVEVAAKYFRRQKMCEPEVFFIQTDGSRYQDSAPGFAPTQKIISDFVNAEGCWTTQATRVVDLSDNTFLVATRDRVFRLRSWDLRPFGAAPDLKTVDIKDE